MGAFSKLINVEIYIFYFRTVMNFVSCYRKIIGTKQTDKQTSTAYIFGKAKMRYYRCVFVNSQFFVLYYTQLQRKEHLFYYYAAAYSPNQIYKHLNHVVFQIQYSFHFVLCAKILLHFWIPEFRVPAVITSNREAQFKSSILFYLCKLSGIVYSPTRSVHPQSNILYIHQLDLSILNPIYCTFTHQIFQSSIQYIVHSPTRSFHSQSNILYIHQLDLSILNLIYCTFTNQICPFSI